MRSSQIILHPGSTMVFLGNRARGVGGAIFVWEHLMAEFIHVNNPDCFIAYSDPKLPPSKWKVSSISKGCFVVRVSKDDGDGNENGKKATGLSLENNNFARASRFFVHFFAVTARIQRESA